MRPAGVRKRPASGTGEPLSRRNAARPDEPRKRSLAESVYLGIKQNIFDFQLLPGDRFTENEVAARLKVSRTPVREALYRLEIGRASCRERV